MKWLVLFVFVCECGFVKAQVEPFDTVFYENGNIKSIYYKGTVPYNRSETHQTFSFSDSARLIADTIFRYKGMKYPEIRNYYPDSIVLWRTVLPHSVAKDSMIVYQNNWRFRFHNIKTIEISISYDYRKAVKSINVYEFDYGKYNSSKDLLSIDFEEGANVSSINNLHLGEYGNLKIQFSKTGVIESFHHGFNSSSSFENRYFAFNSEGVLAETKGSLNGKKNGRWLFFDSNGEIVKREVRESDEKIK